MDKAPDRDRIIVRTSAVGIAVNVLLAAFKAGVGILSNSIAVILDAVNNLSDALSSVITIIGTKLAGRLPDKMHPLGHGRTEYLSALAVSGIVLYAGVAALIESARKIVAPEEPRYGAVSLAIIAVAVGVKLILGRFVKKQGEKAQSVALTASGADALFDAVLSASVLACALFFIATGISLEAYVGAVISAFIIKSGAGMMKETVDDILGHRADSGSVRKIKDMITSEPEVLGAYDLVLNNYGPDKDLGSVHIEVRDTMTAAELDLLTRRLEQKVYRETGVIMTGISVYARNTGGGEAALIRGRVLEIVMAHEWAMQMHGFYVDLGKREMRFDVVMSFDIAPEEGLDILHREIAEAYPGYAVQIVPDIDISDL